MKKPTGGSEETQLPKETLRQYQSDLASILETCEGYLQYDFLSAAERAALESTKADAEKALPLILAQLNSETQEQLPNNLKAKLLELQDQIKTAKPMLAAFKGGNADEKVAETVSGLLAAVNNWLALVGIAPAPVQAAFGKFVQQLEGHKAVLVGMLEEGHALKEEDAPGDELTLASNSTKSIICAKAFSKLGW